MRYAKGLSGLFLTGMLAAFATAQDKPKPVEKPLEEKQVEAAKLFLAAVVKPEPTIANVVANHPDVKLAEAKLQVAKAELEQARLLITQKYIVAQAKFEAAKTQVTIAEKAYDRYLSVKGIGGVSQTEGQSAELLLAQSKSALVIAEADLKALQGATNLRAEITFDVRSVEGRPLFGDPVVFKGAQWLQKPTTQSAKLRSVLERKIELDLTKPMKLEDVMELLISNSGLKEFVVRFPETQRDSDNAVHPKCLLQHLPKSNQTVAAWLQLILDEMNTMPTPYFLHRVGPFQVYYREYGLLMTASPVAPVGALKLEEFMRLPPVVETPKEAPKK